MLQDGQKIVYLKNGEPIGELTLGVKLCLSVAQYIRDYQPFTSQGHSLMFIADGHRVRTTEIQKVEKKDQSLHVQTKNSQYEIQYVGIDLDKVLEDGQFKGCNSSPDGVEPSIFPALLPVC